MDASYLYDKLAQNETDSKIAAIFSKMSKIEEGHAKAFLKSLRPESAVLPPPSRHAKTLNFIGRTIGYNYVLGVLLETEKSISNSIIALKNKTNSKSSLSDTSHVSILRNILSDHSKYSTSVVARFETRHRLVGGNALRAAVLGGNDGLVSNFSLVMGVAGAAAGQQTVLLAGIAGLLAGVLSMALGEWISVKSSQELSENQMQLEMDEIETNPEGEEKELALIYVSKGIPEQQATEMAHEIMSDKGKAHKILVREELGINPEDLKGSAIEAAVSSFILFAIGAIIPVIPFLFLKGMPALIISSLCSAVGLFLIGAGITLFTGKNIWFSGFRQVLFGLCAAAVTFGIGKLIGVSLAG